MVPPSDPFSDPKAVAKYTEGPPRLVPGYGGLLCMTQVLLAERAGEEARILVIGAGGGLELKAFAEAQAGWTVEGVDPAGEMLKLAEQVLGSLASRVRLTQGYVDDAPPGPFDGATCLLTFHFLPAEERRRIAREVRRRLKPGAAFVVAHLSIPSGKDARGVWLSRYAAFATTSGVDRDRVLQARTAIEKDLPILTPEEDEAVLHDAGFADVGLFYQGFTFRGWVGYA